MVWDELGQDEKRDLIQFLVKEIEAKIAKDSSEGEIKITLWTDIPQGMLSRHKIGSSLGHVWLTSSVLNSFSTAEYPLNLGQRQHKINKNKIQRRISRFELVLKYQKIVNDPQIGTRAALAKNLGVSRAFVTIVMRKLK